MSSESDIIHSLAMAQSNLYRYGGPILMGVGTISCMLSLNVFAKKNLRKNPCSVYLIAFNTASLLLIYASVLQLTLFQGYDIKLTLYNLSLCHLSTYAAFLFDILPPFYLILASIDRVLVTSPNARTRRRSTHCLAYICIISGTIFWILFQIHALIFSKIIEIVPNYYVCYFSTGPYLAFVTYYALIIKGILIPFLLISFGLWSIKNIRSVRRIGVADASVTMTTATRVNGGGGHSVHSRDRQLVLILIVDISVYIIFSLMLSGFLMYQQITEYQIKSMLQNQMELLIYAILAYTYYIPFCIGCYTKLLVSKAFRHEIKNVILCK